MLKKMLFGGIFLIALLFVWWSARTVPAEWVFFGCLALQVFLIVVMGARGCWRLLFGGEKK